MYYDTHCHPYLAKEKSQEEILENFFNAGGKYLNTVWCDIESSKISINLAKENNWVFASIGIHPTHVLEYKDDLSWVIGQLESLYNANSDYVIAIWEIWLDYHWLESLSEKYKISQEKIIKIQKDFFNEQIKLADKLNLPIIIHNRSSAEDVLDILKEQNCQNFVFHCYSEDLQYAKKLLKHAPDCMLGFGWVTTFKSAKWVQETAQNIALKNIIIETDSPYLTPTPLRWKQENEPILVKHVLSRIIDLREEKSEIISKQILENSINFFKIKK